jgi:hypothetical protein
LLLRVEEASMKCPHCLVEVHESWVSSYIKTDVEKSGQAVYHVEAMRCPACADVMIRMYRGISRGSGYGSVDEAGPWLVHPRAASRVPLPSEVDDQDLSADYVEACLVLQDSPKASAALSRRCLQNLLRKKAGVKPGNLSDEIQQVLDSKSLSTSLADSIDGIRNIGNFGAHPMKSKQSGEILPVETGEAEWNLDVLEALFDFYYVQPARIKAKRDALNKKLEEAGKPPMKKP